MDFTQQVLFLPGIFGQFLLMLHPFRNVTDHGDHVADFVGVIIKYRVDVCLGPERCTILAERLINVTGGFFGVGHLQDMLVDVNMEGRIDQLQRALHMKKFLLGIAVKFFA